jgi:acetoin utilization deacetylase AcuC-like enzyme
LRLFYSPDYTLAANAFETTRKSAWIARSLEERPIEGIEIVAPPPVERALLDSVHDPDYVRAVERGEPRERAETQGFVWDPGLWSMVCASSGGAVAAALEALRTKTVTGSLSSGLHHARRARGAGFCTFNGLALAARAALSRGATRILIVDLDAHCGGGTHELLGADERIVQVDVSVDPFDGYRPSAHNQLELVTEARRYLGAVEKRLASLGGERFDLVLYNAGMDPFEGCSIGGLAGVSRELLADRERLVFEWCRARALPVAFVLAGGYLGPALEKEGLVELHRLTLEAAR